MTLQNRVKPNGEIVAAPERGTMMGNRGGKFHSQDQTLGKRRFASKHWICCELSWKGQHHQPMGKGYTSLFFLDEVTALAAGHRPCFHCRRQDAQKFLEGQKVTEFDKKLHAERLHLTGNTESAVAGNHLRNLPQGAMFEAGGEFYALKNHQLLRWSFAGYLSSQPMAPMKLLTPPSIVAILQNGYQPRWHESAEQWT